VTENRSVRYGVLALVAALALGLSWFGLVRYQAEQRAALAAGQTLSGDSAGPVALPAPVTDQAAAPVAPPVPLLVVHVAGAVSNPGVYRLDPEARVSDAIAAAGGALPEGAPDVLNLAARLADGDKVYVYTRKEVEAQSTQAPPAAARSATVGPAASTADRGTASGGATASGAKVSVNTATVEQLDAVPSITPTVAKAIVEYRTKNGPFKRLDDLDNVKGIGSATLAKIRDHLTL
jgi:competence protein ComEA